MFIGHVGVALALKKAEPKINVGWLCLASLWVDILLWTFALFGVEQVIISPDYQSLHFLQFVFPYSHSVVATIVWTLIAFFSSWLIARHRRPIRAGLVMAAAVVSHFVLDLIVHPPEMPIAGEASPRIGLGLWNHLAIALALEALLAAVGLWIYYRATIGSTRLGSRGPIIFVVMLGILSLLGQATSPTPPNVTIVAVQGLLGIIVTIGLLAWFDSKRHPR